MEVIYLQRSAGKLRFRRSFIKKKFKSAKEIPAITKSLNSVNVYGPSATTVQIKRKAATGQPHKFKLASKD